MAKEALETDRCCVIGLQSTGEARTADVVAERGEELDDFVSGPRVQSLPKHHRRMIAADDCCLRMPQTGSPAGDHTTRGASGRSNFMRCMQVRWCS
jgi:hypothetical protein